MMLEMTVCSITMFIVRLFLQTIFAIENKSRLQVTQHFLGRRHISYFALKDRPEVEQ